MSMSAKQGKQTAGKTRIASIGSVPMTALVMMVIPEFWILMNVQVGLMDSLYFPIIGDNV